VKKWDYAVRYNISRHVVKFCQLSFFDFGIPTVLPHKNHSLPQSQEHSYALSCFLFKTLWLPTDIQGSVIESYNHLTTMFQTPKDLHPVWTTDVASYDATSTITALEAMSTSQTGILNVSCTLLCLHIHFPELCHIWLCY